MRALAPPMSQFRGRSTGPTRTPPPYVGQLSGLIPSTCEPPGVHARGVSVIPKPVPPQAILLEMRPLLRRCFAQKSPHGSVYITAFHARHNTPALPRRGFVTTVFVRKKPAAFCGRIMASVSRSPRSANIVARSKGMASSGRGEEVRFCRIFRA